MPGEGGWIILRACLLFNLALEREIRDWREETSGTIFYKSTQILTYADDVDVIGPRLSYVAEAYLRKYQNYVGVTYR